MGYLTGEKHRPDIKRVAGWMIRPKLPSAYRVLEEWWHPRIEAIHTPGHSEGHYMFRYTPEGGEAMLFIGDIYKNHDGRLVSGGLNWNSAVLRKTQKALEPVLGSGVWIYPSHGKRFRKGICGYARADVHDDD